MAMNLGAPSGTYELKITLLGDPEGDNELVFIDEHDRITVTLDAINYDDIRDKVSMIISRPEALALAKWLLVCADLRQEKSS